MPLSSLRKVQAGSIREYARGLATDKFGNSLSERKFHEVLKGNDKLRRVAFRSTSMSAHEAKKFLDEFSKEIGKSGKSLQFSTAARKIGLDKRSTITDYRDFKVAQAYRQFERKELRTIEDAKPKGKTPEQLRQEKRVEAMKKAMHIFDAQRERLEAEKKAAGGPQAVGSASDLQAGKDKGPAKADAPKQNKSFGMPSFAGGAVPSRGRAPEPNPLLERVASEEQSLFPEAPTEADAATPPAPAQSAEGAPAPAEPLGPIPDEGQTGQAPDQSSPAIQESSPQNSEPAQSQPSESSGQPSDGGMFSD